MTEEQPDKSDQRVTGIGDETKRDEKSEQATNRERHIHKHIYTRIHINIHTRN